MQKMGWFWVVRGHSRARTRKSQILTPHLHLAPPQGLIPVEFRGDLWHPKTRVPGLSCGVVCVLLIAVLVELRLVTDTDRQTDTGPWLVPRDATHPR